MDFLDWQKEEGVAGAVRSAVTSRIHILRFVFNEEKGQGYISRLDRVIVFVDPYFQGDSPKDNEYWVCDVKPNNNVFLATPIVKVTSSFLMGLDDKIREEIYDALWNSSKKDLLPVLENRYRESAMISAREQLAKEHQEEIDSLRATISTLETQLKQNRILLQSKTAQANDEIVLTSADVAERSVQAVPVQSAHPEQSMPPRIPQSYNAPAPGIPESIRVSDGRSASSATVQYTVFREGRNLISSDSFLDDRYFVHISPNRKYLVVRPNPYGEVICVNRMLQLQGLGDLSPFVERRQLYAHYSPKYGGMLIEL